MPWLPQRLILMEGRGGPVPYDWNVYAQNYFGLWGSPKDEDWQIERILQRVSMDSARPVQVGLVPDLPRFDQQAFHFMAELKRYPVVVTRQISAEAPSLLEKDYLLMSAGEQTAFGSAAPNAKEINSLLADKPEQFELIETLGLPGGETVRLYRVKKA